MVDMVREAYTKVLKCGYTITRRHFTHAGRIKLEIRCSGDKPTGNYSCMIGCLPDVPSDITFHTYHYHPNTRKTVIKEWK